MPAEQGTFNARSVNSFWGQVVEGCKANFRLCGSNPIFKQGDCYCFPQVWINWHCTKSQILSLIRLNRERPPSTYTKYFEVSQDASKSKFTLIHNNLRFSTLIILALLASYKLPSMNLRYICSLGWQLLKRWQKRFKKQHFFIVCEDVSRLRPSLTVT